MPKIKVIHFLVDMGRGGLEQVVMTLVQSLDPEKFNVEIWYMSDDFHEVADQLRKEGKTVRMLGIRNYYNPLNIFKLAALLKKHKPDIIHSHIYFASTISRIAGKLAGIPVIVIHMHNVYLHYTKRNLWIERMLSYVTDQIICCSKAVEEFVIQSEGIAPDKSMVIHNGIDMERFDVPFDIKELKQSLNIREDDFVVIMVASLMEKKGHKYFFDALAKLLKDNLKIKCLLVGYGTPEEESRIKEYASKLNLNKYVMFLGLRKDVSNLLRIANLFVLSSLTEGLPLSVIEAMAAGLPIVATDVGGVKEVIEDGITGVLVKSKDSEALYQAIRTLKSDTSLAQRLAQGAYRVSREKFSSWKMVKKIEEVYLYLMQKKLSGKRI